MARGINSTLLVKKQAAVNTFPTFGATAADAATVMPFTDESLRGQVNQVQSQALRRNAMRQRKLSTPGTIGVDGDFNIEATNNALHVLLPLLFNSLTDTTAPVVDAGALPTVYDRLYALTTVDRSLASIVVDDGDVVKAYANMVNTAFTLGISVDQLAKVGTTWAGTHFTTATAAGAWPAVGITGNIPAPGTAYTVPSVEYGLYFNHANLEIGTAGGTVFEIPVTDFNLSVNFNADTNRNRIGSRYRRDIPTGIADVTGSFTMDANTVPTGGTGALAGKDWAYKAILNSTYLALKLTFTDGVNTVPGGANSTLTVNIPYILIDTPAWNISGPDIVQGAINFTGFADGANGLTIAHKYAVDKAIPAVQ